MYFVEKAKEFNFIKNFDYMLFIPVIILTIVGMFVVKSATLTRVDGGSRIMLMQSIGLAIGIILAMIVTMIDYKDIKTMAIIFYIISVFLLILVLIIGKGDQYGSRSWLDISGVSFQPSELTKIPFMIIISIFLERISEDKTKKTNVLKLIIYSMLPIALVIIQKDFGTTMVFMFIFFVMLFIYGIKYKYILISFWVCLMTTPFFWFFILNEKRKDRIRFFLNPELDPLGAGFNVSRSKMAIGSGQIYGKELFRGIQTQNSSVPVNESDFIFSVIGEELGFIRCVIIISLIFFILLRCLYIAKGSRDLYGSFMVIGVSSMFAIHYIENIGMSIGLLPVTGIPMPFVSAGGSAMITNYLAIGLVMSVSMRRKKVIFNS